MGLSPAMTSVGGLSVSCHLDPLTHPQVVLKQISDIILYHPSIIQCASLKSEDFYKYHDHSTFITPKKYNSNSL